MALTKTHNRMIQKSIYNVVDYGADPTGVADSTQAIDAVLAETASNGGIIRFPEGTYNYTGTMSIGINGSQHKRIIHGEGPNGTTIKWTYESGQLEGIQCPFNFRGLEIKNITFEGAGKAVQNNASQDVSGLTDRTSTDSSNNILLENVVFKNWSGDGLNVSKWFQCKFAGCWARDIGNNGYVIGGGQTVHWEMSGGSFFQDNDGINLWIKRGTAVIIGYNAGPSNTHIKLGDTSTDRAYASIFGANCEWIKPNGTGIYVDEYSRIDFATNVTLYGPDGSDAPLGTEKALYGVYFHLLNGYNIFGDIRSVWFASSDGAGTTYPVYINAASSSAILVTPTSRDDTSTQGADTPLKINGPQRAKAVGVRGNIFYDEPILLEGGTYNKGAFKNEVVNWSYSDGATLDLDISGSGEINNQVYIIDTSGGTVTVNLPPVSSATDYVLTFKKVSASNNLVLSTFGSNVIDGVDNRTISVQWTTVTIICDGSAWYVISN